jgi:hypothetical protein
MMPRDAHFQPTADEAPLDAMLREQLPVNVPGGLADRIVAASLPHLQHTVAQQAQLQVMLLHVMPVASPPGLADRIVEATAHRLPRRGAQGVLISVIGRIGFWTRGAVAAALLLGTLLGIWALNQSAEPSSAPLSAASATASAADIQRATDREVAAIRRELARFERGTRSDDIDVAMLTLSLEIENLHMTIQSESAGGGAAERSVEQLRNELHIIDAEAWVF